MDKEFAMSPLDRDRDGHFMMLLKMTGTEPPGLVQKTNHPLEQLVSRFARARVRERVWETVVQDDFHRPLFEECQLESTKIRA